MNNRFLLQKSENLPNWWVLTDKENMIVVRWEQGKYNESQKFSPLDDADLFAKFGHNAAYEIARIAAEIADYLRNFHYDKVFELSPRQLLGAKIMTLRNERGLSIRELAEKSGVAVRTIVNIQSGAFSPRVDILERILTALDAKLEIKPNV